MLTSPWESNSYPHKKDKSSQAKFVGIIIFIVDITS